MYKRQDLPWEAIDKAGKAADNIGKRLADVAAAFRQGTITTTFTSYATSVSGNQFLQFATLSQEERFRRTDQASTGFGYIPLPDVIVEANAPVTYTYYRRELRVAAAARIKGVAPLCGEFAPPGHT